MSEEPKGTDSAMEIKEVEMSNTMGPNARGIKHYVIRLPDGAWIETNSPTLAEELLAFLKTTRREPHHIVPGA